MSESEEILSVPADATLVVPTTTSYWTEGELIPLKGKWWRVKLLEIDGERIIGLVMQKDTGSALRLAERKQRWKLQHPDAVSGRGSVRG